MNHEVQVHMHGESKAAARAGLHMNAQVHVVVPSSADFAPPPPPSLKFTVDASKVTVGKGG